MNPKDRLANNLVALGSAAVFTVYAAGYLRTRSAAQRFAVESSERRRPPAETPVMHVAARAPVAEVVTAAPVAVPTTPKKTIAAPPSKTTVPKAKQASGASASVTTPAAQKPDSAVPSPTPTPTTPAPAPVVATAPVTPRDTATATPANKPADSTAKVAWKDGVYFGWGTSRHGDIQAGVEIKDGKIKSAFISECLTQYSCSWVSLLPGQVVKRQSAEVDFVSGATQSANAFYYAVVDALKKAK